MLTDAQSVFALLGDAGARRYGDEPVSQLEHALQCAAHAQRSGADASLVAAALLHDIGHLVAGPDELSGCRDLRHEELGAVALSGLFGPEVTEPIRLHVAAKRYLCAVEPAYVRRLSAASQASLALQGGQFDRDEAVAFAVRPYAQESIRLRKWDDAAKIAHHPVPDLDSFRGLVMSLALSPHRPDGGR